MNENYEKVTGNGKRVKSMLQFAAKRIAHTSPDPEAEEQHPNIEEVADATPATVGSDGKPTENKRKPPQEPKPPMQTFGNPNKTVLGKRRRTDEAEPQRPPRVLVKLCPGCEESYPVHHNKKRMHRWKIH